MVRTLTNVRWSMIALVTAFVMLAGMVLAWQPEITGATHGRGMDAGFIKFDGIEGEANDPEHDEWIELTAWSNGMERATKGASGSARSRGSASLGDIIVTKELDKSSPKLQEAVVKGKVFPKVEIHGTATTDSEGRQTYYAWKLKNVVVTSYQVDATVGDVPQEQFSLNFEEIKVVYTEYGRDGSKGGNVEFEWKVEEGTK